MTTLSRLTVFISILHSAICLSAAAQSSAFTYQGSLSDNGSPASGIYDIRFTIYDDASVGAQQGESLTNSAVAVTNGLFTVTLDFGDEFPGTDRWLEIGVVTNGGGFFATLAPRHPITSTPYAIKAANAMTVDAGTLSNPSFLGTTTSTPLELQVNNRVGLRLEYPTVGAVPNLVGGFVGNNMGAGTEGAVIAGGGELGTANSIGVDSDYSAVGGGSDNNIGDNSRFATISGGAGNDIGANSDRSAVGGGNANNIGNNSFFATISGGDHNNIGVSSAQSTIGGGWVNNIASNSVDATISGGFFNGIGASSGQSTIGGGRGNSIASNSFSATISGGQDNDIGVDSGRSTIGGGRDNTVGSNSWYAVVAGGLDNRIGTDADYSTITGGFDNTIGDEAEFAFVAGGRSNSVGNGASYTFAAGRRAKANHPGSFVWADYTDADFASTRHNQFLIRAEGGVGIGTTAPGARLEVAGPNFLESAIRLRSSSSGSTNAWDVGQRVISSSDNYLSFEHNATLALALRNTGQVGIGTTAPEGDLHIRGNGTTGSVVVTPNAGNSRSQILLAENTSASLGMILRYAGDEAANPLHFIGWNSDVEGSPLLTIERNGGDVGIGTSNPTEDLHVVGNILATGTITPSSDRNLKKNFDAVTPREVLARVASLPIQQWTYKAEDDTVRHVGPMAQDFHAAFGLGANVTTIATVDADGVALAAIQGLNEKVESRSQSAEVSIRELRIENAELKSRVTALENLIANLNSKGNEP